MADINNNNNNIETVNSNNSNIKTVNSYSSKVEKLLEEIGGNPEGIALSLAEKLDDNKSLIYYKLLAVNINSKKLFEALSITLDAERREKIRYTKPIYFIGILKKWGLQTKWRENDGSGD